MTARTDQLAATGADILVSPQWLAAHLEDPMIRVVEVDVSAARYDDWHIEGAVLWNVYRDLKDDQYRPVPTRTVERLLSRSGIRPDSTVVVYGYAPAMAYWLLTSHGHQDVRLLNCSRETWRDDGLPRGSTTIRPEPTSYGVRSTDPAARADHSDVLGAIGRPGTTLVDVRSAPEYAGERFWPSGGMEPGGRAGHIPSAVHLPMDDLYDDRGAFVSTQRLFDGFSPAVLPDGDELITYCTVGGRASTAWFVLTRLLGRHEVRVYDGSWAEWGRMSDSPIEPPTTPS
jgi:thiosulfate/3-mercaptopyruvate sulfurtransferase